MLLDSVLNAITPVNSGWSTTRTAHSQFPISFFGAMGERKVVSHVKLFLNLENLGNVRQSRWAPILLPARAVDGRWTVDAWAPLDGRVINGCVRLIF